MGQQEFSVSRCKTLSILLTYRCTAECRDCGTLSSPRESTFLSKDQVFRAIDEAKRLDFSNVVFTGGEATLAWPLLLASIKYANAMKFPTRLVSNAHWATNERAANERLAQLIDSGLSEINFSTGDEHIRFVPIERVLRAVNSATRSGLRVALMIELRAERAVTREIVENHPTYLALGESQRNLVRITESPWMPIDPNRTNKYPEDVSISQDNLACQTGCDSILQTYTLGAEGNIRACCGLSSRVIDELVVGHIDQDGTPLETAIEEAEADLVKLWIKYIGTEKLLSWAASKDPSIEWENLYAHRCQSCLRIYSDPKIKLVVRNHYKEILSELVQNIYFDEVYLPSVVERNFQSHV